ncbi:heat shock protein HspQ [Candidatus Albibeggiatoa sp. nov. NOAA]|uniref:heat shock protein HspQ n=1 Tax=Candidatus Albibeggiatoa sp. nov. NOAA TaxID=3162724 RepID=UPI0032FA37CA|nr:heat shock protein HspQ [Thiotrichaceae bacterium]
MTEIVQPLFFVGQLVYHTKFNYRGVIIDVDPQFMLSDTWYEQVAKSRPPKDKPWYHVLVHSSAQQTYVAERHLSADNTAEPIEHPAIKEHFSEFKQGRYILSRLN